MMDMLTELSECNGEVFVKNFTKEENKELKKLEELGLVARCWVILPKGKQKLKEEHEKMGKSV